MQTKGIKTRYSTQSQQDNARRIQIRNWIILIVMLLLVALGVHLLTRVGDTTTITMVPLTCTANQDVTAFGDSVLYYDSVSVHCLSSSGSIRWSFPVGSGASFSCSDTHVIIWVGSQLYIVDQNGRSTYNEAMAQPIQFARVSDRYAAVVIGDDTSPELLVKDLTGSQVDEESEAFSNMMLMDVGFFGDQGQYMWTLALDVYGTAINSVMNTFQVGKMNTGNVSLGDKLCYKVLFENKKLRTFTTQQLYSFDYKGVQDTNASILIYGWKYIDSWLPERSDAYLLLAPTGQTASNQAITELRVLNGTNDRRFTLPSTCVGAMVYNNSLYAFSGSYIYRTDVSNQRYYAYALPLEDGRSITAYLGKTTTGKVLLACDDTVYSVTLPKK